MKLNLGCGNDYREGWVNVDTGNCRKDLHHDIEDLPLPFADNTFDEVLMMHVLEHVERRTFPDFMRDLHRICKPDALIHIEVPYYNSRNAWTDFTHKNFFTEDSFGYFDRNSHLRENGIIYGIDFTFKVDVRGINGNGTIKYDLHAEKTPQLATVINFCTLDAQFLPHCLANVRSFSGQIIVAASTHFFDGTPENREELARLATEYSDDKTEFLINDYDHEKTIRHGSRYWHNFARWSAVNRLRKVIDHVLLLDADEIIEGDRFSDWLAAGIYREFDAVALTANWYFREPSYQATTLEQAGLLVRKDAITEELIFDDLERWSFLGLPRCSQFQSGLDGRPMLHHFSWVRTKEEMLRKVSSWGHNRDLDWRTLVEREFAHDFSGRDFVHRYCYRVVEPYIAATEHSASHREAQRLIAAGKPADAIAELERLLDKASGTVPVLKDLALLYYGKGEKGKATACFQKALELAPWDIDTLNNLANLYFEMKDPVNALKIYRKLVALNPGDAAALLATGNLHYILGEKKTAATYFAKTLEIDPGNDLARRNIELLGKQENSAIAP
jgi:tetratricopeptide (TPR) repeat protein